MNADMVDPRDFPEKCFMNGSERRALRHLAEEMGLSKSKVLLLAFRKFEREIHDQEVTREYGLSTRTDLDRD